MTYSMEQVEQQILAAPEKEVLVRIKPNTKKLLGAAAKILNTKTYDAVILAAVEEWLGNRHYHIGIWIEEQTYPRTEDK